MRKKKILLTFSKNRNSKVYSYTFNIYCAYWLLQYKAMVILKIFCNMARLIGSLAFIWVALEGGVCSSINPVPCKQVSPACGAAGRARDIRVGLSIGVNNGSSSFLGKSDFWWVIGDPMKWMGDRRIWDHGTGP